MAERFEEVGAGVRARVFTKWVLYYAFGVAWLAVLVFLAVDRIRTSSAGAATTLTIGGVVAVGLLGAAIGFTLWVLPNARSKAALQRRFPTAVILTARRDDFRAFIDVDALNFPYRLLPFFVTVVADQSGMSAWMAGDRGREPLRLLTIPWKVVGVFEQSASAGPLPQFVLLAFVKWDGEKQPLELTLGSKSFGGMFPQSYGSSRRSLEAVEAVRY